MEAVEAAEAAEAEAVAEALAAVVAVERAVASNASAAHLPEGVCFRLDRRDLVAAVAAWAGPEPAGRSGGSFPLRWGGIEAS